MYLHRIESTHGRLIPKPKGEFDDEDEHLDEVIPIQDQIETLRAKISLKEKYNRVLSENFEESRQGAHSILYDLFLETRELRFRLMAAIKAEQTSVQNALRSYRIFQLSMTDRIGTIAVPWLYDKLFDATKKLNVMLHNLRGKRSVLEEAERIVVMIEKWPRPGTLPWEVAAYAGFERLDNMIENIKIKGVTASILYMKYYNIKFILREEQGKYLPTLRILENLLQSHKQEFQSLQQMLDDAAYFRAESFKNLTSTEKEASENRKQRRKQMAKIKKAVDKVLTENHHASGPPIKRKSFDYSKFEDKVVTSKVLEELKYKKEIVTQYCDRARRLVEAMRVSDLTHIPKRSKLVTALGIHLQSELNTKEAFRDILLKQKNQLILISCHFRYSGQIKLSAYKKKVNQFKENIDLIKFDYNNTTKRLQRCGNISIELRLSILAILLKLDSKKRYTHTFSGNLQKGMKQVYSKIKKLIKSIKPYEELFNGLKPERNYDQFVKQSPIQPRHIRIGSPIATDESEEEDMADLKVPTRQDIKNKSLRFINQAILRKGLR